MEVDNFQTAFSFIEKGDNLLNFFNARYMILILFW